MSELSDRERLILNYITDFYAQNGYSPSVRNIQNALGIRSTATVHSAVNSLVEKHRLLKDARSARSLRPVSGAPVYSVPVMGTVTAGQPILAVEDAEGYVSFCTDGRHYDPDSLFALKIRGSSMTGVGIMDGDTVIVEKTPIADDGTVVVALIDDEATVKTFYRDSKGFRLQPENSEYEPIYTDHVRILGRVISSIRYY